MHERRQSGSGSSGSGSSRRSVHDKRRQSGRSRSGSSADSCARPHVSMPIAPPASAQSAIAQTAAKSASGSATRFTSTRSRAVRMAAQPRTGRSSWTTTKVFTHSSSRCHPQRRRQGSVSASVRCSAFASPSTRRSLSSSCARTHGACAPLAACPSFQASCARASEAEARGGTGAPLPLGKAIGRPRRGTGGSHRRSPRWGPDGHGAAFRAEIEGRSRARWAGRTCRQSVTQISVTHAWASLSRRRDGHGLV